MNKKTKTYTNTGFSLIELLVVIVIIGILSATSIAGYKQYQEKALAAKLEHEYWENQRKKARDCASKGLADCGLERKIGTQIWAGFNANIGKMITNPVFESSTNGLLNPKDTKMCFNHLEENCEIYGGLYTARQAQSVCPSGWHLPTSAEIQTLYNYLGGYSQAGEHAKEGGSSGLNLLMGPGYTPNSNVFYSTGNAFYWMNNNYFAWIEDNNESYTSSNAYRVYENSSYLQPSTIGYQNFHNVRCLKN